MTTRLLGALPIVLGVLMLVFRERVAAAVQRDVDRSSASPRIRAAQERNKRILVWAVPTVFILVGIGRLLTGR